jgi:hypothetical protein
MLISAAPFSTLDRALGSLFVFACNLKIALQTMTRGGAAVPDVRMMRRDESAQYRICFLGMLDSSWSAMLGDMLVTTERLDDNRCLTTLSGSVADQAALMGVLNLAYDLGMVLLWVEREPAPQGSPG